VPVCDEIPRNLADSAGYRGLSKAEVDRLWVKYAPARAPALVTIYEDDWKALTAEMPKDGAEFAWMPNLEDKDDLSVWSVEEFCDWQVKAKSLSKYSLEPHRTFDHSSEGCFLVFERRMADHTLKMATIRWEEACTIKEMYDRNHAVVLEVHCTPRPVVAVPIPPPTTPPVPVAPATVRVRDYPVNVRFMAWGWEDRLGNGWWWEQRQGTTKTYYQWHGPTGQYCDSFKSARDGKFKQRTFIWRKPLHAPFTQPEAEPAAEPEAGPEAEPEAPAADEFWTEPVANPEEETLDEEWAPSPSVAADDDADADAIVESFACMDYSRKKQCLARLVSIM
jgi:hypothetical protein